MMIQIIFLHHQNSNNPPTSWTISFSIPNNIVCTAVLHNVKLSCRMDVASGSDVRHWEVVSILMILSPRDRRTHCRIWRCGTAMSLSPVSKLCVWCVHNPCSHSFARFEIWFIYQPCHVLTFHVLFLSDRRRLQLWWQSVLYFKLLPATDPVTDQIQRYSSLPADTIP